MCDGTEESIQALADYEAANGVLAICPATMTIPEEELFQAMKAAKGHKNGKGADLVGINMEGPFINKEKKVHRKKRTSSWQMLNYSINCRKQPVD